MERFMVCCGAKFFRPGSILLPPILLSMGFGLAGE